MMRQTIYRQSSSNSWLVGTAEGHHLKQWILLGLLLSLTSAESVWAEGFERMKYNNPGLVVDLGVGLWAWPLPMDYDGDGDNDLVVSCPDKPYDGIYFFENLDGDVKMPVFKPAVRIGSGKKNIQVSHVDGKARILRPNTELVNFRKNGFGKTVEIYSGKVHQTDGRIRAKQWTYCDFEDDGDLDLIVGIGDWTHYGWENAYNARGEWERGPLHGFVYLFRNNRTTANPEYAKPEQILAGGKPIDVFGMPSPNLADFDGDGDLDIICGEFVDKLTWFENRGTRRNPQYAKGRFLARRGQTMTMDLCMIVVSSINWDKDGDIDLVVGEEDGRVAFVKNTGRHTGGMPEFLAPRHFQQQAADVKFGALVTPCSVDWDNDGDEDLICGNSAGYIGFIENLDGGNPPRWAKPIYLRAQGEIIRILAGPNGSVQGPCETKWGYTTLSVADWDHDGLADVIVNSIWGKVVWYRNVGAPKKPQLAAARPIEVDWPGRPPKPAWNWWNSTGRELSTQWRTTPMALDVNGDDLTDLVMLDHEGFLSFFERRKESDRIVLLPGKRIFRKKNESLVFDNKQNALLYDFDKDGRNDLLLKDRDGSPLYVQRDKPPLRSTRRVIENADDVKSLVFNKRYANALRLNAGYAGRSGRRKLAMVDWDGDGRLDLLANSQNIHYFRNVAEGKGEFLFEEIGKVGARVLAGHTTSPTVVDWDKNGVPDLLVGAEDGFLYYLKNPR